MQQEVGTCVQDFFDETSVTSITSIKFYTLTFTWMSVVHVDDEDNTVSSGYFTGNITFSRQETSIAPTICNLQP